MIKTTHHQFLKKSFKGAGISLSNTLPVILSGISVKGFVASVTICVN